MHMLGERKKGILAKPGEKYATRVDELEPMTVCPIHHATNKISSYFIRIKKKTSRVKHVKLSY